MLLKKGSRGNDVKTIQKALHLLDDGIFGAMTEEAVKDFQKSNGLKVDGIVGDATWVKLIGVQKSKRVINEIIVHCSATREGKDYTVADITRWHKARGWSTIGYHYVIYRDGSVHTGRDVNISGAHCEGHNTHSIGVCYIGGLEDRINPKIKEYDIAKDTRTVKQKESLMKLLRQLRASYPSAKIRGHRDFAKKACPSFDATKEYSVL